MKTYKEVVNELEARPVMPEKAPDLEPTKRALEQMGFFETPFWKLFQQDPSRVIIVAGTNGKGSVSATLEALFLSKGERVGLYTSPHLVETTERIRVNGADISQTSFVGAFECVSSLIDDNLGGLGGHRPTHFEMLTLMAIWYFTAPEVNLTPLDRIILEVGLGGLWDATNAIPHGVCVITQLGLDHENILGSGILEVARNKFGVVPVKNSWLQNGALVVHAPFHDEEVKALALRIKEETDSKWVEAHPCRFEVSNTSDVSDVSKEGAPRFFIHSRWGEAQINLAGARGVENTSLALQVFYEMGFDPSSHLSALKTVNWPGRMQLVLDDQGWLQGKRLFLSGDHNPQGAASLRQLLPSYNYKTLHVLVGIGKDKNADEMLESFFSLPRAQVYLTETPFRGRALKDYGSWRERAAACEADPQKALNIVLSKMKTGDMAIVTGSLYLVGKIKSLF